MKMTEYDPLYVSLSIEDLRKVFEGMEKSSAFNDLFHAMAKKSGISVTKEDAESLCELIDCGCCK